MLATNNSKVKEGKEKRSHGGLCSRSFSILTRVVTAAFLAEAEADAEASCFASADAEVNGDRCGDESTFIKLSRGKLYPRIILPTLDRL